MSKAIAAAKDGKKLNRNTRKKGELDGLYLILLCALTCAGLLMLISAGTPDSVNAQNPYKGIIKRPFVPSGDERPRPSAVPPAFAPHGAHS